MFEPEEIVNYHVYNHILARKRADPKSVWGEKRFAVEPTEDGFRRLASMMNIRPGMRILHTHTTSDHFRQLLESVGAKVDAYDISLDSALRAGAKLGDASRLLEWSALRNKYDAAFSFEPTHLFHVSGSVITAAAYLASLKHAVKDGRPIYIAAHASYSGGSPADNFQAVFDWMGKHFGLRYSLLRDSKHGEYIFVPAAVDDVVVERDEEGNYRSVLRRVVKPVPLHVFKIPSDPRVQRMLINFARAADRAIVPGLHELEAKRAIRGDVYSDVRKRILDRVVPRLMDVEVPTVHGSESVYSLLLDYARKGNAYLKTF